MDKEIIINRTTFDTRIAVLEAGVVSEFFVEQDQNQDIVGNLYKGRVIKILPGINSAFVDIGAEKASFLHVDDVIYNADKISANIDSSTENSWNPEKEPNGNGHKNRFPIQSLLHEGQDLLVQVSKGPISSKGARITANISLPGCYLVFMPHSNTVGISRQIHDDNERKRLRDIVLKLKPKNSGFIIRTIAEEVAEVDIQADIHYLLSQWNEILWNYERQPTPSLIYKDLSLTQRVIRDLLPSSITRILVDNSEELETLQKFLKQFLPRHQRSLQLYRDKQSIFEAVGIEDSLHGLIGHKAWLPSGGYLVIDQAEALTAIDINTGRFVGKESHEETILTTNLEATTEVVRQLKLRNIGGIIIIDFIDMNSTDARQQVYQALKEALKHDRARSKILQISEMGLVEMTRKRDRESIEQLLSHTCPYCQGTGKIKSLQTVVIEIFREIKRLQPQLNGDGHSLTITAHPDVIDHVFNEGKHKLAQFTQSQTQPINWRIANYFHHEQFEVIEF